MSLLNYSWDFSYIWGYKLVFLKATIVTLELTALSIFFGTILGVLTGVILSSYNKKFREFNKLLEIVVDTLRSIPVLILILIFNYYFAYLTQIRSPFVLAVLALSFNLASFVADLTRASLDSVPKPQIEAGLALGMNQNTVIKRIVLPEAFRAILPPLGSFYIEMLKCTSLASIISVNELVHVASELSARTYRFLESYATLAVIYLALIMPFTYGVRKLEKNVFIRRS